MRRAVHDGHRPRVLQENAGESVTAAFVAMHAHESMTEQAAFEVSMECVLDETGIAEAVLAGLGCQRERVRKMAPDGFVQHGVLGLAAVIWLASRRDGARMLMMLCSGRGRRHSAAARHRSCRVAWSVIT
jgi:hypothetical protein